MKHLNLCCVILLLFPLTTTFFFPTPVSGGRFADFLNSTASPFSKVVLAKIRSGIGRLERIRSRIHHVFHQLGHNPNATILHALFPHAVDLISKEVLTLERCYHSTVFGHNLSIFEQPLGVVVHKYLELYGHYDYALSKEQNLMHILKATRNLLRTIRVVAEVVIDCVHQVNKNPKFRPTMIALNKFSSWSSKDTDKLRNPAAIKLSRGRGQKLDEVISEQGDAFDISDVEDSSVPKTLDYRKQGVVSPIKDQGHTGTCFIFGPLAAAESSFMLQSGKKDISFSEHDILNCLKSMGYKSNVEDGGSPTDTLDVAMKHGLILESSGEPYFPPGATGDKAEPTVRPEACKNPLPANLKVAKVQGFIAVEGGVTDEMMLKKILYKYGPVATIFRSPHKNPLKDKWNGLKEEMNFGCVDTEDAAHSMAVIGWDENYFIFKNSYGNDPGNMWGKDGYLYLNKKYLESCAVIGKGSQIIFPMVE